MNLNLSYRSGRTGRWNEWPAFYGCFRIYGFRVLAILALTACCSFKGDKGAVSIIIPQSAHPRIMFGAQKLRDALQDAGYVIHISYNMQEARPGNTIRAGIWTDMLRVNPIKGNLPAQPPGKEGFLIRSTGQGGIVITGSDNSGVLYGLLELADEVRQTGKIPASISLTDTPQMVLRGTCIGLQKSTYLPGRGVYEYPYTRETFPWFYDKALWIKYLDSLAAYRMNSLYLWNGHPFASLVRTKEYPYAVEVDDATFKKNEHIYRFITEEADRRGIWVIQMFYNIIVSKPFAEKNGLKTQDRNRPIIPVIADYTRKSIAAFVEKYPHVGLMVALGEAMEGVGNDDVEWFTKTIIPGVKDGLKALGQTEEPPIVLRAHDTDPEADIRAALPLYKNLYTEAKYNGEALTTYTPRGPWAELHRKLSHLGTVQIENVHIMANLEPFRYGATSFIQKCVQAMHSVHGGNGLHLYPQASYWDWPYTADNTAPRLLQIDRDWIWYRAWARYAWNADRDKASEASYWGGLLGSRYGCSAQQGKDILEAYEEAGEIAPKLLRRFGITDGNRQTLTLGMLMSQLVAPERFNQIDLLYNSEGPEGERLAEYAAREWKGAPHTGETPVQIMGEVRSHGLKATEAMERAAGGITANKEEFTRLRNDMYCYRALAGFYASRAGAALSVLRYGYSKDLADLKRADTALQHSIEFYKELTRLTEHAYLYANSMQTGQRKIPVRGNDGKFKTWKELLPVYEEELATFDRNIDSLQRHPSGTAREIVPLVNAPNVALQGNIAGFYSVQEGARVFTDTPAIISAYAKDLQNLKGIPYDRTVQMREGTTLRFTCRKPVTLLIGFFDAKGDGFLPSPQLETDASANDYGQAEIKISNALLIGGMPPVQVHAYSFTAGTHTLALGKGICLVLGFIDGAQPVPVYDAGLNNGGGNGLDWLFN